MRLAELIAALSLATDLGMGQPMEHGLRTALLAVHLGDAAGLDRDRLVEVYYLALLRWVGCTSHAHELSVWFGDDIAAHARAARFDFARPTEVVADMLRHAGAGLPPLARARALATGLSAGKEGVGELFRSSCEVAQNLAERLGFGPAVTSALGHLFERWDGKGWPRGLRDESVALSTRVVQVAQDAEVFHRAGGVGAAVEVVRSRAGTMYDPSIADLFCAGATGLFDAIESRSSWDAILAAEPGSPAYVPAGELDGAMSAMADFADLKSPFTAGHSRGVARLAEDAARRVRLPEADVVAVRQAGLLHDLGRTGVPNGIWDKRGVLTASERERVRLHPYLTERMLARSDMLRAIGELASRHHERLDGSGYHRGTTGPGLPLPARIVAAADAYHAMREPRAYREPLSADAAASELRRDARAGRLDPDAVDSVLAAAGHRPGRRRDRPAGLTAREVEVLRLVARGLSNREIGGRLHISARTAGHHVQHIYTKIGVGTRAAAALFAMQQGLVDPLEDAGPVR